MTIGIRFLRQTAAALVLAAMACAAAAQWSSLDSAPADFRAGRFEQAIAGLDAQLPSASGEERVTVLYWRGEAQGALGARGAAVADLSAALREGEGAGAPRTLLAAIYGALGMQLLKSGATSDARGKLERAFQLSAGVPVSEAAALSDLGELARREGRDSDARRSWTQSLELAERAGAHGIAAAAATSLLREALNTPEGVGLARRAAASALAMPDSHAKAYRLIALAQLVASPGGALRASMLGDAHRWLESARAIGTAIGDLRSVSHASGQLGKLYEEAERVEEALALTRRAVLAAQEAGAPEALYRWQWQAARLLARTGRRDEALAGYRRALSSLAGIRQDLIAELRVSRQSYRDTVGPLFLEYADLLLRRARSLAAQPEAQQDLVEARETIESLKAVELEDYFRDECVADLQARQKELDQLAPRTAVLYPIVLPGRVELLVSLPAGMRQIELPVTGAQLAAEALVLRQRLEKRTTHEYLPHAQQLYDWLLRPLEPLLAAESVDTLVVVPDGPLRLIPLAALHDGRQFLVERVALATAPGLRLIEPRALKRESTRALLNGLTLSVQNFPSLPYVAREVRAIRELLSAKVLADKEFLLGNFERELRAAPYSVVHVASHGQFDSDPKKSFLLTFDGRLDMDGLERVMKLTRFRDEPVELLTLSACRTAAGDERAALGLAGVAIKAGARSALATLWYISDQATSELVSEFYRGLADPTVSKARALQQAQHMLLRDARYRHPGYWSPFLLIGNWL